MNFYEKRNGIVCTQIIKITQKGLIFKNQALIALQLNFNGFNFINKYQNLYISKSRKSLTVKFEVENLKLKICIKILELINNEHLCCFYSK